MECGKCIHFRNIGRIDEKYTCKYLKSGETSFYGDSVQTAEMCPFYKEQSLDNKEKKTIDDNARI